MKTARYIVGFVVLLTCIGCSEELDLYAPAEEIYAVYAALDAEADTQYVRIGQVFQVEGDAYAFAAEHDGSVPGLEVVVEGGGQRYLAQWQDSLRRDSSRGDFGPYVGAYYFLTPDSARLQPGERYRLHVRSPLDSSFHLQAATRIPPQPRITAPRPRVSPEEECLSILSIEDSVYVFVQRNPRQQPGEAWGFQLRINFRYRLDGVTRRYTYGPSRLYRQSTGCEGPTGQTLCYRWGPGVVLRALQRHLAQLPPGRQSYDAEPRCRPRFQGFLSDAIQVEATAVDSALGQYMQVNSPFFRSINPVKPEFTNLTGQPRAIGVFGSLARDQSSVTLSPCVAYALGWWPGEEDPCE